MKRLLFTVILFYTYASHAGGGWVYEKGKGYFKLAENVIYAGHYFGPDGSVIELDASIGLYTTSLYAEYGFSNRFTFIAYVPFFVRSTLNDIRTNQQMNFIPGQAINSFGDTDLTFKYGFFQKKSIVLATSVTLGLPLGHSEVTSEKILQTGDGEFNQMVKVEASHSFHPLPIYLSVYGALNNRAKGFSDEYRYGGEIGASLTSWVLSLKVNILESFFNGPDDATSGQNGSLFANNIEYFSFTPEVNYFLSDKVGMSLSSGFALSGKRVLASPNLGLGVFMKL